MLSVLSGNLEDEVFFFFFEIMYMIKYVLLPLAPPAKRDVLQKRRRLIFPVPENWHLCVLRQPWGCTGARSPSPHPCPVWSLVLLWAETMQPLCPEPGGVCSSVFC